MEEQDESRFGVRTLNTAGLSCDFSAGPFATEREEKPRRIEAGENTSVDYNRKLVESVACRMQNDLLSRRIGISIGKVSHAILSTIGVPSFETLGVSPQEIPRLRKLALLESKVNALVHSHVAGKRITTLYDLSLDLGYEMGVREFEDLGLGPLLCHPLIIHYFSVLGGTEVYEITAVDVIQHLADYIDCLRSDTEVQKGRFLAYVAKQRSLPTPGKLYIRIRSLSMHISFIRRSKQAEKDLIGIWQNRRNTDFVKPETPRIIKRVQSFLAAGSIDELALGKRKFSRYVAESNFGTPDDGAEGELAEAFNKSLSGACRNSSPETEVSPENTGSMTSGATAQLCPYPSAAEERARVKRRNLQQLVTNVEHEDFQLAAAELQEFILVLKDACHEKSIHEVLMRIIGLSFKFKGARKRSEKIKIFRTYPAIGLLNVAVLSVKAGYWEGIPMGNPLDAAAETNRPVQDQNQSAPTVACYDAGRGPRQSSICRVARSPVEEKIVTTLCEHYEQCLKPLMDGLLQTEDFRDRAWWLILDWACECENWISTKHTVPTFRALGLGTFPQFLEKHLQVLPVELISILGKKGAHKGAPPRVPKDRVFSFLAQALPALSESESSFHDLLSCIVCKQFNIRSVEEICGGTIESLLEMYNNERCTLAPVANMFFLEALLASGAIERKGPMHISKLSCANEADDVVDEPKVGALGSMTTADAAQCLLNAPFLEDLAQWSQWSAIFAPTLGSLLDWFEREGWRSGLAALVTAEGTLIRVDATATADDFLLATAKGCGRQMAAMLMSLIAIYGGTSKLPTALLKSHATKGLEVLLGSSTRDWSTQLSCCPSVGFAKRTQSEGFGAEEAKPITTNRDGQPNSSRESFASGRYTLADDCAGFFDSEGDLRGSLAGRCVVECLSHVIPEFQAFTANILLPALSSLIADTPAVLLKNCTTLQQKSILHGIGMSLGIPEWKGDFSGFVLAPNCPSNSSGKILSVDVEVGNSSMAELKRGQPRDHANLKSEDLLASKVMGDKNERGEDPGVATGLPRVVETRWSLQQTDTGEHNEMARTSHEKHGDKSERGASLEEVAHLIVDDIRWNEFGIGQDIYGKDNDILTRQHARMGRALHRLSSELYSHDSHFVFELVQNADDNVYSGEVEPALIFLIKMESIEVLNNETGFTVANIRALCDVGNSTKAGTSTGYIGQKGIGFKSVFRVTNSPEIHSKGFHVKFDISEGDLGYILPTWIPAPTETSAEKVASLVSKIEMPKLGAHWNTHINLPIKASLCEGSGMTMLASKFNDLHPSLLLFLNRLRFIAIQNEIVGSVVVMRRYDCGNDIVKVVHDSNASTWMVVRHYLKAGVQRPGVTDTEIALAFRLNEVSSGTYEACSEQQQVFAFLPLRAYGLRFIIQGDFRVPSSREEVDCDSDWNQWLRSEIPAVFLKSVETFQKTIAMGNIGKAVSSFLSFVPMEGEVLGFFSPLPRMILSLLRATPCLPIEGGGWALPCVMLGNWNALARQLLPPTLLNELLGLHYLDKDVTVSEILALKLGVHQFGARTLVDVMKAICQKNGSLVRLGLTWIQAWLSFLHDCVESDRRLYSSTIRADGHKSIEREVRSLPCIPLSNGTFTALADAPVWFTGELSQKGMGPNNFLSKFTLLSLELRTVHPDLVHVENENLTFEESTENVVSILERLGVRRLSAHEVLENHVLPAMGSDDCLLKDDHLVVEYLGFAMSHFESNCVACSSERFGLKDQLQKRAVILTNRGLIRARQKPLHFGPAMGKNTFDINRIVEGTTISWIEVSPVYLEHGSSGFGPLKWREFFKELGVTDFVEVVRTEKKVLDKSRSEWKSCVWDGEVVLDGGWVVQDWHSPELTQLLGNLNARNLRSDPSEKDDFVLCPKERFTCILVALDCLWDDYYHQYCQAYYSPHPVGGSYPLKTTASSFLLLLQQSSWVISSLDKKLHRPIDLFKCCEAVSSVLGTHAPYIVTQIQSESLVKALGCREQVLVDDALKMLGNWSRSNTIFETSVTQMTRLYLFLWEQFPSHKEHVLSAFRSGAPIFVPLKWNEYCKDLQKGRFYPLQRVCWGDPTHTLDLVGVDQETASHHLAIPLCKMYPGLKDFLVRECLIEENPSFDGYLEALRIITAEQPPSAVLSHVVEVFWLWSQKIVSGKLDSCEISRWRTQLQEPRCCIFATTQDTWVSLNNQIGPVCILDDVKLGEKFESSSRCINFILMADADLRNASKRSEKTDEWTLKPLVQALGIPKFSEIVKREVIKYGLHDGNRIEALVGWVLPYAQRYIKQLYASQYRYLQEVDITKTLKNVRFIVVERLYVQYSLRDWLIPSNVKAQCGCVFEGETLYVAEEALQDNCRIYVELSRLFFDGKPEVSVANFLHLITLMASSGSSDDDVENFVQNVQGIPPLSEGGHWTLFGDGTNAHAHDLSQSELLPNRQYFESHVNRDSSRNTGMMEPIRQGWTPNSLQALALKVAERPQKFSEQQLTVDVCSSSEARVPRDGFHGYRPSDGRLLNRGEGVESRLVYSSESGTIRDSGLKGTGLTGDSASGNTMECFSDHVFSGHDGNVQNLSVGPSEHNGDGARASDVDKGEIKLHSYRAESVTRPVREAKDPLDVTGDVGSILVKDFIHNAASSFQDRDFLASHAVNEHQRLSTGRSGEALVFQYLCKLHGPGHVKWINQDSESGAAYDIIVTESSGQQQFVEVKTTKSSSKDWFEISPREWDFARMHSEAYVIMRVFLAPMAQQIRLLILPNPAKLVAEQALQLALLIPISEATHVLRN